MTEPENSSFDPEPSCSYTFPKNNEEKTNVCEIINMRRYRPAPASKKRKREEEMDNELLSICKPLSIKLHRLSQQAMSKVQKKSDQAIRTKRRHRWRNGLPGKSKKKSRADKSEKSDRAEARRKSEKSEESEKHEHPDKSEMFDKCEKSETSINFDKSSESNQISDSSAMIPTHSWGCCRMIPFERNRSRSLRKLSLSRNRDSLEASKDSESAAPRISLRERAKESSAASDLAKNNLHSSSSLPLPVKERRRSTKEEFEGVEDEFVCRRTLPYIRKAKSKPHLQINSTPEASNSRVAATLENEEDRKEKPRVSESEKFSSSKTFKTRRSRDNEETKRTSSIESEKIPSAESKVFEKTDEAKVAKVAGAENARENDDENMEDFAWNSSNMWKYKRKHRSRRISSSSEDEGPRKKRKIADVTSERRPGPSSKRKGVEPMRTLCPPSCTKAHHGTAFNFLYEKPKLKEGRVLLEKLEEMQSEEVVRWRNRLIKLEKEVEELEEPEEPEEEEEEEEEDEYYLMYEDGTLSNEVLSQEDIYQMQGLTEFDVNSQENNHHPYQMNNLDLYFNVESQDPSQLNNDELDDVLRDDDDIPLEFSEYPKILLIRLETLVGSLETEYSASEIENLEEKYIDFMMNSNFSYDKQSQSFFQVYKRLHARRAKERELDSSDFSELDDDDSESETERDDYVDEKPLVIALDADKELASDCESSLSAAENDRAIATIRILPNDSNDENDESEISPPIFVTCERGDVDVDEGEKNERFYITCKFCKVSFKNLHSFSLHKADCYTKNKKPIKCDYCDNQYKCRRTLKLHMQHIHGKGEVAVEKQKDAAEQKVAVVEKIAETVEKMGGGEKVNLGVKKRLRTPAAQLNLVCGVCSVEFESKESLWDHILKHTEQELQDAYKDATKKNKNQELQDKLRRYDAKKKERELENQQSKSQQQKKSNSGSGSGEQLPGAGAKSSSSSEGGGGTTKKEARKSAFKYAQWKDRILYKMNINDKNCSTSVEKQPMENNEESEETNNHDEIVLSSSSESESNVVAEEVVDRSLTSRSSAIRRNRKSTTTTTATATITTKTTTTTTTTTTMTKKTTPPPPSKIVTMCPCHRNDTSTMVNGDMQIEMVLLCKICQVLFRRLDCFEVHYRMNKVCSMDRSSRSPKLFCSSCRIILNSLPEMRNHLEKHAKVNRQGHVTFLCNICKVMFFGVGSLFYSHWFNHNKDVNFLASRYSFPKLSIVQIVSTNHKAGQNQKEDYLFVAEYVCKNCKIPFGSESDLEKHACSKPEVPDPAGVAAEPKEKKNAAQAKQRSSLVVRVSCMTCKEVFPNREAYNRHEKILNHLNSTKPEYICVSSNNSEKAYICTQCKTVRMSIEDLKEHWFFHRPWREKFSCANCPDVRSSRFEEIETHCKRCNKNVVGVCLVALVAATYQCKPCNLHFETGAEWKEHRQMCKPPTVYKAYAYNPQGGYEPIMPGTTLPPPTPISTPTTKTTASTVVSTVATALASSLRPVPSGMVTPSRITVAAAPASAPSSNLLPITRSVPKSNFIAILPKPTTTPTPTKPKLTSATLLEKYLQLGTAPKPKPKSKKRQSEDVEVIEILSESSSRSSVTEFSSRETSSVAEVARKETTPAAVLNSSEASPFDSYTVGNKVQSEYQRKDVSVSKAVVCYPSKRKDKKPPPRKDPAPQIPASQQENSDDAERNLAMTAVNPEFESLLSELEGLEADPLKSILRMVRKKTKENLETSLLNSPGAEKSTPRVSVEEVQVEDASVSEVSSKCPEKDTLSPLPFEVVLLPEEAPSPKSGPVSQTCSASKTSNSEDQSGATDKNINSEVSKGTSEPGSSIIEEYIEYIMMDETAPPAAEVPKVEKAPTRLRVRSLAELQEIKMHLCETCGESFNAKQSFDDHARENNCARARDLEPPPQYVEPLVAPHREPVEAPHREQSRERASEVDYEAALRQNLVRRGVLAPNEFVPPLVPFTTQQHNASTSKAVMTSVSANLVIPEKRKSLPSTKSQYSNNTGVISPSSSTSRFSLSHAPRSGAIQLPERTGGSVIQKRPSGAATRIQNLNHRSEIHHRGLPQTYNRRNSLGVRPPPPYPSNESTRAPIDIRSSISSLSCSTCSFTAKNLSEFSSHLVMHYMETDQNRVNEDLNQESLNSLNSPNTSGFTSGSASGAHLASAITSGPHPDIQSIAASDVYSGRSTAVTGNWQTPARYIYACQLCDFRTESKASIRLHEKNHSTVAVMRQKNLQRLQNQQMITQAFQTQRQQQQHQQQSQQQMTSSLSQLMESSHGNSQQQPIIPEGTSAEQSAAADLYNRVSRDIFQCQLCNDYSYSTQEELTRHLDMVHKESASRKEPSPPAGKESAADSSTVFFVCDYCETPQIFESEVNLRKHMNFLHNHLCQICNHRCTSRERLQNHMLRHKLENQTQ